MRASVVVELGVWKLGLGQHHQAALEIRHQAFDVALAAFQPADHVLVDGLQKPLAGVQHLAVDLHLQFFLQPIEGLVDFVLGAGGLDDLQDLLLEVYALFDGAKNLVAGTEHAVEQAEFLVQQFVDALLGLVLLVQEVDHGDVDLLAIAVATTDALLDPLGVPGQVEVDQQRAELKIDAFGTGFGGDQNGFTVPEGIDDGGLHVGALGAGNRVGALVASQPVSVDGLAFRIRVGTVQQRDFSGITVLRQQLGQVGLGADRLGEDDRLVLPLQGHDGVHHLGQHRDQLLALGVHRDAQGKVAVAGKLLDLGLQLDRIDFRLAAGAAVVTVIPFLGLLGGSLVIGDVVELGQFELLQALNDGVQRDGDGEGRRPEDLADDQGDQLVRFRAEGDGVAPLQVGGQLGVEFEFILARLELEGGSRALGVVDVPGFLDILAQGPSAERLQSLAQHHQAFGRGMGAAIDLAEAGLVTEYLVVDHRRQTEQFHQGILHGRGGQQNLEALTHGIAQGLGADGGALAVDVPEPMGFVENHQIPADLGDIVRLAGGEFVGSDDHLAIDVERPLVPGLHHVLERLGFKDLSRERELVLKLLGPLLAQRRGDDEKDATAPLSPALGNQQF